MLPGPPGLEEQRWPFCWVSTAFASSLPDSLEAGSGLARPPRGPEAEARSWVQSVSWEAQRPWSLNWPNGRDPADIFPGRGAHSHIGRAAAVGVPLSLLS